MKRTSPKGVRGRLWTGSGFRRGWLAWKGARIAALGEGDPPRELRGALEDLGNRRVIPGFVDTLLHGFAGVDAGTATAEELDLLARRLARAGVTSAWCGFYPLPAAGLRRAARAWDGLREQKGRPPRARLKGWHLEGPFLDPAWRGALPGVALRKPTARAAQALVASCGGWLRMTTLSPELPGAFPAARALRRAGVRLAIGHTGADLATCFRLAEGGPIGITHLGNRMPALTPRQPGPIGFALAGGAHPVGVIPDGVHAVASFLEMLAAHPGLEDALMFQSDCLAPGGTDHHRFVCGGRRLVRDGGVARDARGNLAGTLLPLSQQLLARVAEGTLSWDQALRGGCQVPGGLLRRRGRLRPGFRADLVALEAKTEIAAVWVGGRRVPAQDTIL
ncbi:MAG: hypothetical protein ACE5H3_11480 [Planctomycetota bacterium]